jgi:hypothetical protein
MKNLRHLGFEDVIPEESWLSRVIRFVDRENVMEFFKSAVNPIPVPPTNRAEEMVVARRETYSYFVDVGPRVTDNKAIKASLCDIIETNRRFVIIDSEIRDLDARLVLAQEKSDQEKIKLKVLLANTATAIRFAGVGDMNVNFEEGGVFVEGDDNALARAAIKAIIDGLKFIYCADAVLTNDDESTRLKELSEARVRMGQVRR